MECKPVVAAASALNPKGQKDRSDVEEQDPAKNTLHLSKTVVVLGSYQVVF